MTRSVIKEKRKVNASVYFNHGSLQIQFVKVASGHSEKKGVEVKHF